MIVRYLRKVIRSPEIEFLDFRQRIFDRILFEILRLLPRDNSFRFLFAIVGSSLLYTLVYPLE